MVDLDRRQPETREARRRSCLPNEPRERVTRFSIAITAEVDSGQHDLYVPLDDSSSNLFEDCRSRPAARRTSHERDDAEVAREAAAVLNLHEGPHALQPRIGLNAAD